MDYPQAPKCTKPGCNKPARPKESGNTVRVQYHRYCHDHSNELASYAREIKSKNDQDERERVKRSLRSW